MAGASPSTLPGSRHNFLGVELFAPLVAAANARRDAAGGGFCRDSLPLLLRPPPLWGWGSLPPLGPLRPHILWLGKGGGGRGVRLCDHKVRAGTQAREPFYSCRDIEGRMHFSRKVTAVCQITWLLPDRSTCSFVHRATQPALCRRQHQRCSAHTGGLFACIMPVQGVMTLVVFLSCVHACVKLM